MIPTNDSKPDSAGSVTIAQAIAALAAEIVELRHVAHLLMDAAIVLAEDAEDMRQDAKAREAAGGVHECN